MSNVFKCAGSALKGKAVCLLTTGHYLLICGGIIFILHFSFVWEDTGVSCYFRFCIMNWECVNRPTFLEVVPWHIWKTHGHCSYAKPPSRKIHNVAIIWISLHASNGLHNERYLAYFTIIWNEHNDDMIVVEKLAKWICTMPLDLNFEYFLDSKFLLKWVKVHNFMS